jgi:hypothetical protein
MQLVLGPERFFILGPFLDEKLFIFIILKMILSLTAERNPSLQFGGLKHLRIYNDGFIG